MKMKMKKLLAAMLACAMLASFAACSSSEDKPAADNKPAETTEKTEDKKEETKKDDTTAAELPAIGVTIYKYDDNFMTYTRKAMENAAKDVAVLNLNDSQNDQTKQLEQIDVLINQGVKALIINLVDPSNAPVVAEKAKAANIPVVFVNKEYPEGTDKIDYDKCVYVGTTSEESGIIQGQLILDAWNANKETWDKNGDGKLQYVMLMGEVGHPDAEARTKYSIQTLNDNGVETQELANQSATWDTAKAKDLMDTWLVKFPTEIEAVICNNDGMAEGVITALNDKGYNLGTEDSVTIPVFGVDATDAAKQLIADGKMTGTIKQDAEGMANGIAYLAKNVGAGKDLMADTGDFNISENVSNKIYIPYATYTGES